jgi:hypothetical protein
MRYFAVGAANTDPMKKAITIDATIKILRIGQASFLFWGIDSSKPQSTTKLRSASEGIEISLQVLLDKTLLSRGRSIGGLFFFVKGMLAGIFGIASWTREPLQGVITRRQSGVRYGT